MAAFVVAPLAAVAAVAAFVAAAEGAVVAGAVVVVVAAAAAVVVAGANAALLVLEEGSGPSVPNRLATPEMSRVTLVTTVLPPMADTAAEDGVTAGPVASV